MVGTNPFAAAVTPRSAGLARHCLPGVEPDREKRFKNSRVIRQPLENGLSRENPCPAGRLPGQRISTLRVWQGLASVRLGIFCASALMLVDIG